MKRYLLALNHAFIFFCSSLYLGLFWSLHFFFFPSYTNLKVGDYYSHIIPQTTAATRFFFVEIPIMSVCLIIMLITEWKTRLRWVPILWIPGLLIPVYVQQALIEPINTMLANGVTDQAQLDSLLQQWMFLNNVRWIILTIMWGVTMYYFIAKGNLLQYILPEKKEKAYH
jgi:hypothetical protein